MGCDVDEGEAASPGRGKRTNSRWVSNETSIRTLINLEGSACRTSLLSRKRLLTARAASVPNPRAQGGGRVLGTRRCGHPLEAVVQAVI